jgi:integrase
MARSEQPEYLVVRKDGRFDVSPPIVHPPYCVCAHCRHPKRASERDWAEPVVVRARRISKYPTNRPKTIAYALALKADIEARLRDEVAVAKAREEAIANAVSVARICAHYIAWQKKEKKDWKRDQYRVNDIEDFLGPKRDAATVDYRDFERFKAHLEQRGASAATIRRAVNTLIAMFNRARKDRLIKEHQLIGLERPKVEKQGKPVIFTKRQVAVLLGSAMVRYERKQVATWREFDANSGRRPPSVAPLRGFCLIAYLTLMRPETNFNLTWEQIMIAPAADRGRFSLDHHKNAGKGVEVDAPLNPVLVRYLRNIMPSKRPEGLVHPNPATGAAYGNIRKQWFELVQIANEILAPDEQLTGARTHFYTWRHTGASHLAASSKDPVLVTRMMGDTQLQTVMDHYFDSDYEHMQTEVERWQLPSETDTRDEPWERFASAIASDPN